MSSRGGYTRRREKKNYFHKGVTLTSFPSHLRVSLEGVTAGEEEEEGEGLSLAGIKKGSRQVAPDRRPLSCISSFSRVSLSRRYIFGRDMVIKFGKNFT